MYCLAPLCTDRTMCVPEKSTSFPGLFPFELGRREKTQFKRKKPWERACGEICCSKREMFLTMNSKGQRGNCIYNRQWKLNSQYKGWLTAFKGDRKKALCKCYDRIIDVSNMGEGALKSHMKSERHKNNSGSTQPMTLTSLTSFGFLSCGNRDAAEIGKAESLQSKQQPAMIIGTQLSECLEKRTP